MFPAWAKFLTPEMLIATLAALGLPSFALDGVVEGARGNLSAEPKLEMAFGVWAKVPSPLSNTGPRGALALRADNLKLFEPFGSSLAPAS